MELAHLETFLTVYRTRNVTQAARVLHLSQPAVTAHIKALEAEAGRPLFERLPRGVAPTPIGHTLADRVAANLDALRAVNVRASSGSGELHIGGPIEALTHLALPLLAPLVDQGMAVRVMTGDPKELAVAVTDGHLDVALLTRPVRQRGLALDEFAEETLLLVGAVNAPYDWARVGETNGAVLERLPLLAYDSAVPLVRRYWRERFGQSPPRPAVTLPDLRSVASLLEVLAGWSVLPDYLAGPLIASKRLKLLDVTSEPVTNRLFIATASARVATPELIDSRRRLLE